MAADAVERVRVTSGEIAATGELVAKNNEAIENKGTPADERQRLELENKRLERDLADQRARNQRAELEQVTAQEELDRANARQVEDGEFERQSDESARETEGRVFGE